MEDNRLSFLALAYCADILWLKQVIHSICHSARVWSPGYVDEGTDCSRTVSSLKEDVCIWLRGSHQWHTHTLAAVVKTQPPLQSVYLTAGADSCSRYNP